MMIVDMWSTGSGVGRKLHLRLESGQVKVLDRPEMELVDVLDNKHVLYVTEHPMKLKIVKSETHKCQYCDSTDEPIEDVYGGWMCCPVCGGVV